MKGEIGILQIHLVLKVLVCNHTKTWMITLAFKCSKILGWVYTAFSRVRSKLKKTNKQTKKKQINLKDSRGNSDLSNVLFHLKFKSMIIKQGFYI